MDIAYFILFFIAGIAVGSFLNVVIDRLPAGQSIVNPPSHCSKCQHKLSGKDLIPVISYIILKGCCRYCGYHIPVRLLIVELVTGLLFVLLFWRYGLSWILLVLAFYTCLFIILTFIDIEHGILPNSIIYPAIVMAIVIFVFIGDRVTDLSFNWDYLGWHIPSNLLANLINCMIGGIFGLVFFLIPVLVSRGGMGMGDVKLAGLIGFMTGFPLIFVSIFIAIITGGIVAGVLLILGVKKRKDSIPFGPFLCLGGLVTLLWGSNIILWYLGVI